MQQQLSINTKNYCFSGFQKLKLWQTTGQTDRKYVLITPSVEIPHRISTDKQTEKRMYRRDLQYFSTIWLYLNTREDYVHILFHHPHRFWNISVASDLLFTFRLSGFLTFWLSDFLTFWLSDFLTGCNHLRKPFEKSKHDV